jgi:UDP-N-acetylglucosamine 2-epimerase (non-hydrolysing)
VGTEYKNIYQHSLKLLRDEKEYQKRAAAVNPYGDGKAVKRIILALNFFFGFQKKRPDNFSY